MVIEDGKFYFIKDEFFDTFKDYSLMENKDGGTKRPCYFCFRDRKNKEIIWFVPISTKYDKYKKIYDNKKLKKETSNYNKIQEKDNYGKSTIISIIFRIRGLWT